MALCNGALPAKLPVKDAGRMCAAHMEPLGPRLPMLPLPYAGHIVSVGTTVRYMTILCSRVLLRSATSTLRVLPSRNGLAMCTGSNQRVLYYSVIRLQR